MCIRAVNVVWQGCARWLACAALGWASSAASAQAQVPASGQPLGQPETATPVVVAGTVPDEGTRSAIVARLRELYGADRVVDQLTVGAVVAPPQWSQQVQKLLSPGLKQVSHGQLSVQGSNVDLRGEVGTEGARQQVAADLAQSLTPSYTVRNGLRVAVQEQAVVDQALANRIVEFEAGSAVLRPAGLLILDEMAVALAKLKGRQFEVIGHTDAQGARAGNVSLSLARAQSVKAYLVSKGLPADRLTTSGQGPDKPVADNNTEAGRARNRRIEFRVGS